MLYDRYKYKKRYILRPSIPESAIGTNRGRRGSKNRRGWEGVREGGRDKRGERERREMEHGELRGKRLVGKGVDGRD